jgi:hypothetical protein
MQKTAKDLYTHHRQIGLEYINYVGKDGFEYINENFHWITVYRFEAKE